METKEEQNQDTFDNTIFAFNIILMSIVVSLGIIGNGLVLLMLRNCVSSQSTNGDRVSDKNHC